MTRQEVWQRAAEKDLHVIVKDGEYMAVGEVNMNMLYLSQGWKFDEEYYA